MIRREDRAKQFAPFDALTGLRKALREKEIEHERTERVEGEITEHDRDFRYIKIGEVKIFYDDIYDVRIISC